MDLEQVRAAAGRAIDCFTNNQPDSVTYVDIDRLARFAAAMLSTEAADESEKDDLRVTAEQFAKLLNPDTRGQLAALRLALGLPLTAGGEG